jgi:hypothetical protein
LKVTQAFLMEANLAPFFNEFPTLHSWRMARQ